MNLSKLWETVEDRGAWRAAVHGVPKSRTRLSDLNNKVCLYWFYLSFVRPHKNKCNASLFSIYLYVYKHKHQSIHLKTLISSPTWEPQSRPYEQEALSSSPEELNLNFSPEGTTHCKELVLGEGCQQPTTTWKQPNWGWGKIVLTQEALASKPFSLYNSVSQPHFPTLDSFFRGTFCILLRIWASQVALVVKNLPANAGDKRNAGLIPELERSPGEGNGHMLQYSCLENPMERGAWWGYSPWGCKESDTTEST